MMTSCIPVFTLRRGKTPKNDPMLIENLQMNSNHQAQDFDAFAGASSDLSSSGNFQVSHFLNLELYIFVIFGPLRFRNRVKAHPLPVITRHHRTTCMLISQHSIYRM